MTSRIRPREIIRQRRQRLIAVTLSLLLAGTLYFGQLWYAHRDWAATDDAFVTGHLITLKAQTKGSVVEVLAENTQKVREGQVLVRLDGTRSHIDFQQAQADLGEAVRNYHTLKSRIESLQHRIKARQAALNQVRHDLQRYASAAREGAVSDQQVQNARDRMDELEAAIAESTSEKNGAETQIRGTDIGNHPAIEIAKSKVRRTFLEYRRRDVLAPVSGYVAKRRAHVGDWVEPGAPLLVIVPLDDLWVEANFLESQIAGIRPGQPAEITLDAYGSDLVYHGRVQGINPGTGSSFAILATDNATGNFIHIAERVPVRIGLDPGELEENPVQPGLSTLTRVRISEAGKPLLSSTAGVSSSAYRTTIYDHELDEAEAIIGKIIAENTPKMK